MEGGVASYLSVTKYASFLYRSTFFSYLSRRPSHPNVRTWLCAVGAKESTEKSLHVLLSLDWGLPPLWVFYFAASPLLHKHQKNPNCVFPLHCRQSFYPVNPYLAGGPEQCRSGGNCKVSNRGTKCISEGKTSDIDCFARPLYLFPCCPMCLLRRYSHLPWCRSWESSIFLIFFEGQRTHANTASSLPHVPQDPMWAHLESVKRQLVDLDFPLEPRASHLQLFTA